MNYLTDLRDLPNYLMFPRALLKLDLSMTDAAVYMLLLDRARLSAVREGWRDELGRVYLFYPIHALAEALERGETAVKRSLKALETRELIRRRRQGLGKPSRIYVLLPPAEEKPLPTGETEADPPEVTEPDPPEVTKGDPPEVAEPDSPEVAEADSPRGPKPTASQNDKVKTKESKPWSQNSALGPYENVFLSRTELTALRREMPHADEMIRRLSALLLEDPQRFSDLSHAYVLRNWDVVSRSCRPRTLPGAPPH